MDLVLELRLMLKAWMSLRDVLFCEAKLLSDRVQDLSR